MGMAAKSNMAPDQRVLLAVFASYTAWLLLAGGIVGLSAAMALMAMLHLLFSPASRMVFRRWLGAFPAAFIIITVFWVFAPSEGPFIFSLLGKSFGLRGLEQGVFFALRFLGFLLGGFFIYALSTPEKLARAVLWFCAPLRLLKIPVHLLYYIIWFAMRSVPVLAVEANMIKLAQLARGAKLAGSPRKRLTGVLSLIIPVFAAGARRSDRFALALQARGFNPRRNYHLHPPGRLRPADGFWLAGLAAGWILFIIQGGGSG
jgi:energy-coupling factor transport system permease protein